MGSSRGVGGSALMVIGWLVVLASITWATTPALAADERGQADVAATSDSEATATGHGGGVRWLTQADFTHGTFIIDQPGVYKLAENISFNPNSPSTLDDALASGAIDPATAAQLELSSPVDAYKAGWPLATQFLHGPAVPFTPGGPTDSRYDPAAYGVGFFAAIAISADDVVLDLNGYTIEQSAEHALLQRFFAVIETADQPFVPAQGPAGFGDELDPAKDLIIRNGTIGRSAHHGVHGNANERITVQNVDFVDYEVAAIALNGVDGLRVRNVNASNRTDVPVLGTYSSARFISVYLDHLVRSGSATTLTVDGSVLDAAAVRDELRTAINDVHHDVITQGAGFIDRAAHSESHALFHNAHGVVDGNSYSFLLNRLGVAVNGFPSAPTDGTESRNVRFHNVHVDGQHSAINEIPGLRVGEAATIDPVGAVWQLLNVDPLTGEPITVSDLDLTRARYEGNVVANAQALVAKAIAAGDFDESHLDVSRSNLDSAAIDWAEGVAGSETLAAIGASFFCNGDSMFHVNKGAIGFKIDSATDVLLRHTSVVDLSNGGRAGLAICDYDQATVSHPLATLNGYGGAAVRGYSVAGSTNVRMVRATAAGLTASAGVASGFDILTDSSQVQILRSEAWDLTAGAELAGPADPTGPNHPAIAVGFRIGPDATHNRVTRSCAAELVGIDGVAVVLNEGTRTLVRALC